MEPGELGEPVQEQELFLEERSLLGICVLVRAPAVPVSKDLPGAREYASNGLFGLRFMGGPWFVQGCLLRQRGEAGAPGVRSTLGKGRRSCYSCFWREEAGEEG